MAWFEAHLVEVLATGALATLLCAVAMIDMRTMRIPDGLNAALLVVGLAVTLGLKLDWVSHVAGAAAGYLALAGLAFAFHRLRGKEGLGLGDAKLMGAAGAWIGWQGLPFALLFGASLALSFVAARAVAARGRAYGDYLPFGPFLAAGVFLVWGVQRAL